MQLFWLIFIATVYISNILFSSFSIIKYQQLEPSTVSHEITDN